MTEFTKGYYGQLNKNQEEINILGGTEELTEEEMKEIASSLGINKYQIHFSKTYSAKKDHELRYLNYNLAYGPKSIYWNSEN